MAIAPERLDFLRRNSKVRLDREGRWSMDGRPVEHPRVQRLFHQGVRVGDGGEGFTLHVGTQWCWIQHVDDTAFFVERARVGERIELQMMDGSTEPLEPSTLVMRGPEDLYCELSGGRRARFLRDALVSLAPAFAERDGRIGIELGGRFHPIREE